MQKRKQNLMLKWLTFMVYCENPKTYNIKLVKEHVSNTIHTCVIVFCCYIEYARNVYIMFPNSSRLLENITHIHKMIKSYTD